MAADALTARALPTVATDLAMRTRSRSFTFAARLLPTAVRRDVEALYTLCRLADDSVDQPGAPGMRAARLQAVRQAVLTGDATVLTPEQLAFLRRRPRLADTLAAFFSAFVPDTAASVVLDDQAALLDYCHGVAGLVGVLFCQVLDIDDPAAHRPAAALGIAMQLTNIVRDVAEDAGNTRRYLPLPGLAPDRVCAPENRAAVWAAMEDLLACAEGYYSCGLAGLVFLPVRIRWPVAVAARCYRAIGAAVLRQGPAQLHRRAVVPGWRKSALAVRALGDVPGLLARRHRQDHAQP